MTNLFGQAKSIAGSALNAVLFAKNEVEPEDGEPGTSSSSSSQVRYKFFSTKNHRPPAPATNGQLKPPAPIRMMQTASPRLSNPENDRVCPSCKIEIPGLRCPNCHKFHYQNRVSPFGPAYRPIRPRTTAAPLCSTPTTGVIDVDVSDEDNEEPIPVAVPIRELVPIPVRSNGTKTIVAVSTVELEPETVTLKTQTLYLGTMTGHADVEISSNMISLKNLKVKNQTGTEKLNINIPLEDCRFYYYLGADSSHVDPAFFAFIRMNSGPSKILMKMLNIPINEWQTYRLQPTDPDDKYHFVAFKTKTLQGLKRVIDRMELANDRKWDRARAISAFTRIKANNEELLKSVSQLDDIRSSQRDRFDLIKEEPSILSSASSVTPVRTYSAAPRRSIVKKMPELVDLDDDETEPMSVDELSLTPRPKRSRSTGDSPDDHQVMVHYPPNSMHPVTVFRKDLKCLQEGEYLNDNILDFYLNYILYHPGMIPDEVREKTLLFNSFFFNKLTSKTTGEVDVGRDRPYNKVKKWIRHQDIFSKDFLIVPVNRAKHWFLLIVCYHSLVPDFVELEPATPTTSPKAPCILLMDSLGAVRNGGRNKLTDPLRNMLEAEWRDKKGTSKTFDLRCIPDRRVKVTEQDNYYDCGLYLLQYVEQFLKDPSVILASEDNDFRHWVDRKVMNDKRFKIQDIIERIHNTKSEPKPESIE